MKHLSSSLTLFLLPASGSLILQQAPFLAKMNFGLKHGTRIAKYLWGHCKPLEANTKPEARWNKELKREPASPSGLNSAAADSLSIF